MAEPEASGSVGPAQLSHGTLPPEEQDLATGILERLQFKTNNDFFNVGAFYEYSLSLCKMALLRKGKDLKDDLPATPLDLPRPDP